MIEISVGRQKELRKIRADGNKLAESEWMAHLGREVMDILSKYQPEIIHRIRRNVAFDPNVKESFFSTKSNYDALKQDSAAQ